MVFVKGSDQNSQLSTYASSPQYCSRVWHQTLWLCVVFAVCILLVGLPECNAALSPTFAQHALTRNHNGFFDSIDKEVVLGDESGQLTESSHGSPRSSLYYKLSELIDEMHTLADGSCVEPTATMETALDVFMIK